MTLHIHTKQKGQDGSEQIGELLDGLKASGDPCVLGVISKVGDGLAMLPTNRLLWRLFRKALENNIMTS